VNRSVVVFLLVLTVLLVPLAAGPGLAQEEPETPVADDDSATFQPGGEPAVIVDRQDGPAEDEAWTFRYLVPTVLAATGLALLALTLVFAFGVRGRYRVVR
jgi:hypothetical protein